MTACLFCLFRFNWLSLCVRAVGISLSVCFFLSMGYVCPCFFLCYSVTESRQLSFYCPSLCLCLNVYLCISLSPNLSLSLTPLSQFISPSLSPCPSPSPSFSISPSPSLFQLHSSNVHPYNQTRFHSVRTILPDKREDYQWTRDPTEVRKSGCKHQRPLGWGKPGECHQRPSAEDRCQMEHRLNETNVSAPNILWSERWWQTVGSIRQPKSKQTARSLDLSPPPLRHVTPASDWIRQISPIE